MSEPQNPGPAPQDNPKPEKDVQTVEYRETQTSASTSKKGFLKNAFAKIATKAVEIGAGAAITMALKACTVGCLGLVMSPAMGIVVAGVAVGIASPLIRHAVRKHMAAPDERANIKLTGKQFMIQAALSGLAGGLGGYFADDIASAFSKVASWLQDFSWSGAKPGLEAPVPAAPAVTGAEPSSGPESAPSSTPAPTSAPQQAAPAPSAEPSAAPQAEALQIETQTADTTAEPPAPALTGLDRVKEIAGGADVRNKVKAAIERTGSSSKRAAAQATKDLAYFLYNGLGGMPKDQGLAVELFRQAAESGNMQAKIDLAVMEFHGNKAAGVPRNVEGALEKLEELAKKSRVADRILGDLVGPQAPIVEPHSSIAPASVPDTTPPATAPDKLADPLPQEGFMDIPNAPLPGDAAEAAAENLVRTGQTPIACIDQHLNRSYLCKGNMDITLKVGDTVNVKQMPVLRPL